MSCASSSEKSDSEDSESDLSPPPFIHVPPSLVACLICSFVAASVAYFFTYSEKAHAKSYKGFWFDTKCMGNLAAWLYQKLYFF